MGWCASRDSVAGVVVGYLLEHDTLSLTPTLPEDARKILILFSGTSTNMLMPPRRKLGVCFRREGLTV